MSQLEIEINNTKVTLYPQKAISIGETLIISDLHLGKVTHFRKSGLSVPEKAYYKNLEQFVDLLQIIKPQKVIFLGDLFHSHYNNEWEEFKSIIFNFPEIHFSLVKGNHDILSPYQYEKLHIEVYKECKIVGNIIFTHEPNKRDVQNGFYTISGHVHPCVLLKGRGRQGLRLPCFYFEEKFGILPAFGTFTGMHRIKPKEGSRVFISANNNIIYKPMDKNAV